MTAFETLENNYVTLTEAELVDTEGGIDPITGGLLIIGGLVSIGMFNGCSDERHRRGK
ncbi:class IIb bacteriocin, lactobin A/cerein 7B family [Streptococcus ruminantium]|uniref:Class IIb bacteriocin, lactobin A/cerein 7B family n=1 Tax=Streptococcus ruminantium TaxID=1917441 RepID=A0ABU1B3Q4_9STRE|nr:class IIb bacteriocin, lactobin A/cerein 7B family [Streptococcus ruminantium]MDQ8759569.1 class IIb bacteriocin, lactobin A/cerein 7B family [Streptococcus ruminantium]MDQ8764466.1 class IIb bacteriocin, lactobin A/cerein 7B family [Streptococcus ruminantium]MDQ8768596.1 class IIb bacteriocin, lactobin A/cerein 7B family [Streptococcus ruminantium]MDQ8775029.1 class IIb bacteriocin, lactobin A/cerein 7B family [Streptococcus ruminantium]MDQ8794995.1 class IIb bacteriocin, lactobin A/cerein